ncbi:MAG TPA: immunoglobulin-like domain-containing protein [Polyangiaceae bacterium]|nr:immunoglobulin-like domain-containing protein [Polyangiaceae bacterium]
MLVKSKLSVGALILAWGAAVASCGGDDDTSPRQRPSDAGSDARDSGNQTVDSGSDARDSGNPLGDSGSDAADSAPDGSDTTGPVITLNGPPEVVVDCGGSFTDPGASATDNSDGAVSVTATGANQITTTGPGRFVVTYSARDAAGNTTQSQRSVYVCGPACGEAGKDPVDLSTWGVVQYALGSQPVANWVRADAGAFSATQTVNADASILLSDFEVTDTAIEGGWSMTNADGDDDFVGFVFGYQDRGHFYLFDWKRATQDAASVGMSLKVVNLGAFADGGLPLEGGSDAGPDASTPLIQLSTNDLWPTAGSVNVQVLKQNGVPLRNSIPWNFNTSYAFFLEFHPGSFRIRVQQNAADGGAPTQLASWSVEDSTYRNGKFGFYNYSQGPVTYTSFTRRDTPGACSTVRDQ